MPLTTIVPRDNYSCAPLQMVIYEEDGPSDDQNQGDGGAQIVANDHLDDLASSMLFFFFANKRFALFTWSSIIEKGPS